MTVAETQIEKSNLDIDDLALESAMSSLDDWERSLLDVIAHSSHRDQVEVDDADLDDLVQTLESDGHRRVAEAVVQWQNLVKSDEAGEGGTAMTTELELKSTSVELWTNNNDLEEVLSHLSDDEATALQNLADGAFVEGDGDLLAAVVDEVRDRFPGLAQAIEDDLEEYGVYLLGKGVEPDEVKGLDDDSSADTYVVDDDGPRKWYRYVGSGEHMSAAGDVVAEERLAPGAYSCGLGWNGEAHFERKRMRSDELLHFPDPRLDAVRKEIDDFFLLVDRYASVGFTHKRGVLMWGDPGVGKSCLVKMVVEDTCRADGVVLYADNLNGLSEILHQFREIEPDRKCIVAIEDIDALLGYGEHELLELMDGEKQVGGFLYLATTNYPDRLSGRITRPGRFDTKIQVFNPPKEGRVAYLKTKLVDLGDEEIDRLADLTDDFSFAEMREFVVGVHVLGREPEAVAGTIRESLTQAAGVEAKGVGPGPRGRKADLNPWYATFDEELSNSEMVEALDGTDVEFDAYEADGAAQVILPDHYIDRLREEGFLEIELPDGHILSVDAGDAFEGESDIDPQDGKPSAPRAGESEDDFMARCVPTYLDEGKPQDQAVAICASTFREAGGGAKAADTEQVVRGWANGELDDEDLVEVFNREMGGSDPSWDDLLALFTDFGVDPPPDAVIDTLFEMWEERYGSERRGESRGTEGGETKYQLPGVDVDLVGEAVTELPEDLGELLIRVVYEEGFQADIDDIEEIYLQLEGMGLTPLINQIEDALSSDAASADDKPRDRERYRRGDEPKDEKGALSEWLDDEGLDEVEIVDDFDEWWRLEGHAVDEQPGFQDFVEFLDQNYGSPESTIARGLWEVWEAGKSAPLSVTDNPDLVKPRRVRPRGGREDREGEDKELSFETSELWSMFAEGMSVDEAAEFIVIEEGNDPREAQHAISYEYDEYVNNPEDEDYSEYQGIDKWFSRLMDKLNDY